MRTPDELRDAFETYLAGLELQHELDRLEDAIRYALEPGGKRIRPVLCLAVAESAGGVLVDTLPAAAAIELVHSFSLVHDDLPALDDDDERRGRPSTHVAFGEGVAVLAGDAILGEAVRLALTYDTIDIARELVEATLGMIGGQYRELAGDEGDVGEIHALKTGRLFRAAIGLGLRAARVPESQQAPWRAFGDEVGLLFQVVDDLLDGDGVVERVGVDAARALAESSANRARERLDAVPADTSVLRELVDGLAVRTA